MMSRPSMYYPSASAASSGTSNSSASSSAAARLAAKQAELEGLRVLKEQSTRLSKEIEKLAGRVDDLVDGGDSFASVMSSWQGVFRAIQISRADMATLAASTASIVSGGAGAGAAARGTAAPAGLEALDDEQVNVGTLVRIPVDTDAAAAEQQQGGAGAEAEEKA